MDVAIIPAYNPDDTLINLVDELKSNGLQILVVNDGSSEESDKIFKAISGKVALVRLPKNSGKGSALKAGISALLKHYPDCTHFITADADGQHRVKDILRVKDELHMGSDIVLTVRNFKGKIPPKSKIGNRLSRWIYTILTGHYFYDNQSGLRGFSVKNIDWLLKVGGKYYDYELNMLYYADKQNLPITTISIDTVYIDGNKSSHFDPVPDTLKIYKRLFKSARVSFLSLLIFELLILMASILLNYKYVYITIPSAGVISAFINVFINKFFVFKDVRYGDGLRTIVYTILRFAVYTAGVIILNIPMPFLPMFLCFNIMAIILIPLEYLTHKLIYLTKRRVYNKEI
jgi:glycosyltransferase involved in cell wall biosynthesis